MMRPILAISVLASPVAAQWADIGAKSVPVLVFREHCLSSKGDNKALTDGLKQMKAKYPKLLSELKPSDRVKLFGPDRPIGWLFASPEQGKALTLSATESGLCEVGWYGSVATLKDQFEAELRQYASATGGQFYLSGDASSLTDKTKTGLSYTIEMPKSIAYIMLVQSNEEVGTAGHPLQLMSIFEAKK